MDGYQIHVSQSNMDGYQINVSQSNMDGYQIITVQHEWISNNHSPTWMDLKLMCHSLTWMDIMVSRCNVMCFSECSRVCGIWFVYVWSTQDCHRVFDLYLRTSKWHRWTMTRADVVLCNFVLISSVLAKCRLAICVWLTFCGWLLFTSGFLLYVENLFKLKLICLCK